MGVVKKASTLRTLKTLDLSKRTLACLERRGGDGNIDELVRTTRELSWHRGINAQEPVWRKEFYSALDNAGYIRHDLCPHTIRVMVFLIACLCPYVRPYRDYTNEQYEMFEPLSDDEHNAFMEELKRVVDRQIFYDVIVLRFGLRDGRVRTLAEVAEQIGGVSRERIHSVEAKVFRALKRYYLNHRQEPNVIVDLAKRWGVR